ncbi:MAG: dockerin type I repeat-containing protein [Prevotella sp.]|nr:dockerin type I repeat-containing protein [Prevotella sp.]
MNAIRKAALAALFAIMAGSAGAATQKGDVNNDGNVNIVDVSTLLQYILNDKLECDVAVADMNGDGEVNVVDVIALIDYILRKTSTTETGDFSDDPATEPAYSPRRGME